MTGNTERKNRASTEHLYRIEAGPEKIDHLTLVA